jgi:hypothetical protein
MIIAVKEGIVYNSTIVWREETLGRAFESVQCYQSLGA